MKIAVCGGGIGGLVLAYALSKHTHLQIAVYEANSQFSGMGTGIGIFRRTMRILYEMGLADAMTELCGPASNERKLISVLRKSNQPVGQTFAETFALGGMQAAHRADFHEVLLSALHKCVNVSLHTPKGITRYDEIDGTVYAHFADGSKDRCDVLVGADGLHSTVRQCMVKVLANLQLTSTSLAADGRLGDTVAPSDSDTVDMKAYQGAIWSGFMVYRTIVPRERLEQKNPDHRALHMPLILYTGQDREITAFPINRGTAVNVSLYIFDPEGAARCAPYPGRIIQSVDVTDAIESFGSEWEPEVMELLSSLTGLETGRWAVSEVQELPTYSHGRVVLLGDAAHAMTPNLGMGAGQAIEDAYLLAELLGHPRAEPHIEAALATYSRIRVPFVRSIVQLARRNGLYYVFRDQKGQKFELLDKSPSRGQASADNVEHTVTTGIGREQQIERISLEEIGQRISRSFEWTGESAEDQLNRAIAAFESTISEP